MFVLALAARKGGVGKTTLACHLAAEAAAAGERVLLADLDPQGSAAAWRRARAVADVDLAARGIASLPEVLSAAASAAVTLAVVDTKPGTDDDVAVVARSADLVLVPVGASPVDLRAVGATFALVREAGGDMLAVVNRAPSRRAFAETPLVRDALDVLRGADVRAARTIIHLRTAFVEAMIDGRVAREVEPRGKAAAEITSLWKEIAA